MSRVIKILIIILSSLVVLAVGVILLFYTPNKIENRPLNPNSKKMAEYFSPLLKEVIVDTQIRNISTVGLDDKNGEPGSTEKLENNSFQIILRADYFYDNEKLDTLFAKKVISHELMHVFSQQNNQIAWSATASDRSTFDAEEARCKPSFYSLRGCFKDDSYITNFYRQFWTGEMLLEYNRTQTLVSKEKFELSMAAWKEKYKDNFISDTATIDPEEDLAESFSVFVVNERKSLNEKQLAKVNFFERFDELKLLRDRINSNLKN
jgi:hypothetical protein